MRVWELVGKISAGYFAGAGVTCAMLVSQRKPTGTLGDGLDGFFIVAMSAMWPILAAQQVVSVFTRSPR
jgi:hypothetical protein